MARERHKKPQGDAPAPERDPSKGGRPPKVDWEPKFLAYYAEWGNARNAALVAGVSYELVRRKAKSDATFKRAYREAYRAFIAHLEEQLVRLGIEKGNVIAILARLKASGRHAAERYSEKAVDARVMNITNNLTLAPPDVETTLAKMAGMHADEWRAMHGEVIDAAPLALNGGGPPADAIEDADLGAGETPGEAGA